MAEVNAVTPGTFCWIELATSDRNGAKNFYTSVFGWDANENDMGGGMIYTIFRKSGRDVAGMYALMPEQQEQGVPPNWLSYVAATSVDDAVAKAQSLGATVHAPPFDVNDLGRMSVLQDPQRAVFAVWQAKAHLGVTVRDEVNTLCWNELATNDANASRDFYAQLFGWTMKVSPEYTEIHLDGKGIGGIRTINPGEQAPPNWMPYFLVDDVDATAEKVQSSGGRVYMPPTDMAGVGRFAVLADPQGAVFALYKSAH
ncbi:MAG TPA: VOC family protein [Thermoanaerobaculia bacterium]|nr:VOC family protein [Thermoanaerobaculia bacterium]